MDDSDQSFFDMDEEDDHEPRNFPQSSTPNVLSVQCLPLSFSLTGTNKMRQSSARDGNQQMRAADNNILQGETRDGMPIETPHTSSSSPSRMHVTDPNHDLPRTLLEPTPINENAAAPVRHVVAVGIDSLPDNIISHHEDFASVMSHLIADHPPPVAVHPDCVITHHSSQNHLNVSRKSSQVVDQGQIPVIPQEMAAPVPLDPSLSTFLLPQYSAERRQIPASGRDPTITSNRKAKSDTNADAATVAALSGLGTKTHQQVNFSHPPPMLINTDENDNTKDISFFNYQEERWMERYQELVAFHEVQGHCNVPHIYKKNPPLGQWVKRQRYQYRLLQQDQHNHLTEERLELLNQLGFTWDSHNAAWDEMYQELIKFAKANNHCIVTSDYDGNPKLCNWVKRQRSQYQKFLKNSQGSTMTLDRISKLENLGMVWDLKRGGSSRPSKWEKP